jgi:putative hemolysin
MYFWEVQMFRKILLMLTILVGMVFSVSCKTSQSAPPPEVNIPNPASIYCEDQGYRVEIRTAEDGSQVGYCIFPDGSECDEWAYFREECSPASEFVSESSSKDENASDGWKIYRNDTLGYSFQYPADAQIITNDDPLKSISVEGPLVDDEYWPQITISHPRDREDYRPPQEVDLAQWLTDHNLLGDVRLPDVQIAGTTAVHLRHDRSPQSYAYDRYFFAKEGQLFMILINHTGDKEDWNSYNHFLEGFQFETN